MDFCNDYRMTLNGTLVAGAASFDVFNPATGARIASAPDCNRDQLDAAVAAARASLPGWRAIPEMARGAMLKQAAAALSQNVDPLMRLLTSEQGKPLQQAKAEVLGSAFWLNAIADMEIPVTLNEDTDQRRSETRHVPLGVVAGISPWNFPLTLAFWKIAPALKTGNTMVLKPSPHAPLTVLKAAELIHGLFPPGVLNVISGGDNLGPWMTSHPGFDKVSFTGSTATGKRVMQSAAADLKRVTLELGGNDAAIVLPDVDIDAVVADLFWAAFRNSGQICIATKRMYIHADIYDRVAAALAEFAKSVKVGDGAHQGTEMGPIQNRLQYDRVVDLIEDAKSRGYRFLTGGDVDGSRPGNFVPITIIDNPPEDARVVREEAFGPVLPLLKFDSIDEVVARANASEYGLAGSVWSSDLALAADVASRLETGTVWINETAYMTPHQAFAGHKHSGIGVENSLDGLLEYTVPQTITIKKPVAA